MNLLIVESPNKIKKLKTYLPGWEVAASVGHIRDLPKKDIGIDIDKGFRPNYVISSGKRKVVLNLGRLIKKVGKENVYLAMDPDREGEAIAFHICEELGLDVSTTKRITFTAISKPVIEAAIKNPRTVDMNLVKAQESRRVIDRLVGYKLSPILWKSIASDTTLSAGRVQSVALRLVVEREEEIENYTPIKEYEIKGSFLTQTGERLTASYLGEIPGEGEEAIRELLKKLGNKPGYEVLSISQEEKRTAPQGAFTTSTLQQEAKKRLKLSVGKTTKLAQSLFEKGKITYIRTDSPNLSEEAKEMVGAYIKQEYGEDQHQARSFRSKTGAQEAHEAIRPLDIESEELDELSPEELSLYKLIRARTLASQMSDKLTEQTKIKIGIEGEELFEAKASILKAQGWSVIYAEKKEEKEEQEQYQLSAPINEGERLDLDEIRCQESFKEVPKRFDEASLVKELEKRGIGRPSTYASIISVLFTRKYVAEQNNEGREFGKKILTWKEKEIAEKTEKFYVGRDKETMVPLAIGRKVLLLLREKFEELMAYEFTRRSEESFDKLASGEGSYKETVEAFYKPFHKLLNSISLPDKETSPGKKELGMYQGKELIGGKSKYGTYLKWGEEYFNIEFELSEIEAEEGQGLLKAAIAQKAAKEKPLYEFGELKILKGKYGLYMKKGKESCSLPKWEQENIRNWNAEKAEEVFASQLSWKKQNRTNSLKGKKKGRKSARA